MSGKMKKILICGTGNFARKFAPLFLSVLDEKEKRLLGFIDGDPEKENTLFFGRPVFSLGKISDLEWERIYIFAYPETYTEIRGILEDKYHIPSESIGDMRQLAHDLQLDRRSRMSGLQTRKPRIYDCFPFYNEFDILKLRLELLAPYVDRFVLVEMNRDHKGRKKPLYFLEKSDDFKQFTDKIICVRPENVPEIEIKGEDWTLENFQRNAILDGLTDAEPEDAIFISDCDEIVHPDVLIRIREGFSTTHNDIATDALEEKALALEQMFCYYYCNCVHRVKWYGSVVVKFKNLLLPQYYREMRNELPYIRNGGWHFTYMGSIEQLQQKTSSIADGIETPLEAIQERVKELKDIYGRTGDAFELERIEPEEVGLPDTKRWLDEYPEFFLRSDQ